MISAWNFSFVCTVTYTIAIRYGKVLLLRICRIFFFKLTMTRFEPSTFGGQQLHYQLSHQHHPPRVSKCFKWANPGFFLFIFVVSIQHKSSISIDGMLRIRTRVRRMVGADKTTELCRPPQSQHLFVIGCLLLLSRYVNLRVWRHRLRHRRHTPRVKITTSCTPT